MDRLSRRVNSGMIGRIILEGEEIEPYVLYDVEHAVIFEIVDGQYRIEKLTGEADVQESGDK